MPAVPKEWYAKHIINNYPYYMWQNAMRMAIEEDKRRVHQHHSLQPDHIKRNWLIFKLRADKKTQQEISEIVDLSTGRIWQIEINCSKKILKNIKKLKQRSQKHGRL